MKKREQNELNTFERTEMKRIARAVLALGLLLPGLAFAANSNATMNLQGIMRDGGGALQTVPVNVTVKLYNDLNDTTALKTYNFTNVAVDNGYFTVDLDDPTIPTATQELWVGIQVAGDAAELPRQHVTSVPYCFEAKHAATATTATSATSAATATDLACSGTCVGDAEIAALAATKLTGTVAIANGGTGSATKSFVDLSTNQTVLGSKVFDGGVEIRANVSVSPFSFKFFGLADDLSGLNVLWSNIVPASGRTEFVNRRGDGVGGFGFYNLRDKAGVPTNVANIGGNGSMQVFPTTDSGGLSIDGSAVPTGATMGLLIGNTAVNFGLMLTGTTSSCPSCFQLVRYGSHTALSIAASGNATFIGSVTATSFPTSSDARLKTNITPFSDALSAVLKLRPVRYALKSDGKPSLGFIAQEVERVVPEVVSYNNDGMRAVDYGKLTAVLAGAVQEQDIALKKLNRENTELRGRLDKLELQLAKLAAADSKPKNKLASR